MEDLTRWNRAGLTRFDYLDGNAAVFLEKLRAALAERFPDWQSVRTETAIDNQADHTEQTRLRKHYLEALYAYDPDDMLWQITRQFARACHVLAGHIDAYANESYLGTASQWENLRLLVEMLDYAPRPPASASTPLALLLKPDKSGTISSGLQVQGKPADGPPVVFETLADLEADVAFNRLYAKGHLRNPEPLSGSTLMLDGRFDKLKSGEPVVLENTATGKISAHLVQGLILSQDTTRVTISPILPAGFIKGDTLVHIGPKEKLAPLGPATQGVETVGTSLQLAVPASGLAAGDLVVIRSGDDKPLFRRLKAVREDRLVFYRGIDRLTLAGATVARAITVPLTDLASPPLRRSIAAKSNPEGLSEGTVIDVVYAAGDWSRLANQWLAHISKISSDKGEREYLPAYRCLHAKYVPVGTDQNAVEDDERPGYTALTLTWHPNTDGVPGQLDFKLNNPQTLLAPPATAGPWIVDTFLNKSENGGLVKELVCELPKQTAAGDLAVVVKGDQMAWARLGTVALDNEHEEASLNADPNWQGRGGGPFFLSRTRVFSHFTKQARVVDWQKNDHVLTGKRVPLEVLPPGLKPGRALIIGNGGATLETRLAAVDLNAVQIDLADDLPAGTTYSNLTIYANVVDAGHGESRPQQVLGSGDGTLNNQQFTLTANDLSFVADATMNAGVRADLSISVGAETWLQVSNLKDSGPADAHYQVRIDQDGKAAVQFGDGRHGRRLPSGGNNVRVVFRQGVGLVGNMPAGSITKVVKPHPLLASVSQPILSSGGADRESSADLRDSAPATLLALDRAVSLEDFSQLARSNASIWQARAFRQPPGLGQRECLDIVVMAAGGDKASDPLKSDLYDYLIARALPGVTLSVSDYVPLLFKLEITIRVRLDAFDKQTVQLAVRQALQTAFSGKNRRLGQTLYRGEVYKVVDGVTGVENSDCRIVLPDDASSAVSHVVKTGASTLAVRPSPRQCLIFDSTGFVPVVEECRL